MTNKIDQRFAYEIHREFEDLVEHCSEHMILDPEEIRALLRIKRFQQTGKLPRGFDRQRGDTTALEQEILTPSSITDFVRDVFGGQIMLDPCGACASDGTAFGTVCAQEMFIGPEQDGTDGLVEPWTDRTFCNPPFGKLKDWLVKARIEAFGKLGYKGLKRIAVLCPVRTNRTWFRAAQRSASAVVMLNPVAFVGHTQAFPAPLCLMFFNVDRTLVENNLFVDRHMKLGELV